MVSTFSLRSAFLFRSYRQYLLFKYHESGFQRSSYQYDRHKVYLDMLYHFYVHFFTRTVDTLGGSHGESRVGEVARARLNKSSALIHKVLLTKRSRNRHTKKF